MTAIEGFRRGRRRARLWRRRRARSELPPRREGGEGRRGFDSLGGPRPRCVATRGILDILLSILFTSSLLISNASKQAYSINQNSN